MQALGEWAKEAYQHGVPIPPNAAVEAEIGARKESDCFNARSHRRPRESSRHVTLTL